MSEKGILLHQLNFTISLSLVSRESPIIKTRKHDTVNHFFLFLLRASDIQMSSCQIASEIVSVPNN